MYANVIFVVHYSPKDRSWTISFPFMRLWCWPAEWRYSNYSFLYTGGASSEAAPLPSVKEKLAYRRTAGEELSSYNETSAILVKQKDAELQACLMSGPFPAEVFLCESVWTGHKLTTQSIQAFSFEVRVGIPVVRTVPSKNLNFDCECMLNIFMSILRVTHNLSTSFPTVNRQPTSISVFLCFVRSRLWICFCTRTGKVTESSRVEKVERRKADFCVPQNNEKWWSCSAWKLARRSWKTSTEVLWENTCSMIQNFNVLYFSCVKY